MSLGRNLAAGIAAAVAASPVAASSAECRIEIADDGAMATISAYASDTAASSGDYVMDTEIRTGGNRSLSRQAGKFEIADVSRPVLLARSIVGRNPSSEIRVHLTLSASGETVECRNETR